MLLHCSLLVAHVDGWLHGKRLTELALSRCCGGAVASQRFFDGSKAMSVQH
jgi:hypothetical protein